MKKKLILLIGILFANDVFAVENPVVAVDNGYQHELICKGSAQGEEYKLKIEWSKTVTQIPDSRAPQIDSKFQYQLENLTQNTFLNDTYEKFFGESNTISEAEGSLLFSGNFKMWKRLGYIARTTEINLNEIGGVYYLKSQTNTHLETFKNPKDWCNPPTRFCGSEPIEPEPIVTTDLHFESSACEFVK